MKLQRLLEILENQVSQHPEFLDSDVNVQAYIKDDSPISKEVVVPIEGTSFAWGFDGVKRTKFNCEINLKSLVDIDLDRFDELAREIAKSRQPDQTRIRIPKQLVDRLGR